MHLERGSTATLAGRIDNDRLSGRTGDGARLKVDDEEVLGEKPSGVAHRRTLGYDFEPLFQQGVPGNSVGIG